MQRAVYLSLLRLHPRCFRERFAAEMVTIFDTEVQNGKNTAPLFADLVVSLLRQWLIRHPNRERAVPAAAPVHLDGLPLFQTLEGGAPRSSSFVNGAAISLALLSVLTMTMGRGQLRSMGVLIGSKYPRSAVLPVDRNSIADAEPTTQITIASPPVDPLYKLAEIYFNTIPVLKILDANGDLSISAWEMITAASSLPRLDRDHDGELDPQECGLVLNADLPPDVRKHAPAEFMRLNPVLAALDADHNGRIGANEIVSASTALRSLDRNRDGSLTPVEIVPERVHTRTAIILSRIDTDRDRNISRLEQDQEEAELIRPLLLRADRNRDGVVTAAELTRQLQFEEERKAQQERALGQAGYSSTSQEERKSAPAK